MKNPVTKIVRLRVLVGIAALLSVGVASSAHAGTTYEFGVVPQFAPRKLASIWLPILEVLSRKTGLQFKMVGSPEIPQFELSYLAGQFDFAYVNPYHAVLGARNFGSVPLVRDGGRALAGILVVKKDSTVKDVKELQGKAIAFPAPNALAASLVVRSELATLHGVTVKPVYVNTHSSIYLNTVLGKTAAGGGVYATLRKQKKNIQDRLRVIYTTRKMNPHPVTVHPRVPAQDREKVREAFLEMARDKETAKLLANIPMRKAIAATMDDYKVILEWNLDKF
jgi:phosphonate transport system substrate-binding protein